MNRKHDIILKLLFCIYIIAVLRITVFRSDFSFCNFMKNGSINISLFKDYIPIISQRKWFMFIYLFFGNIIWFVPFGMYLEYFHKYKSIWTVIISGFLFSFVIESLQYVFGTGYSELDDLILNTSGAFAGAVFVKLGRSFLKSRKERKRKEKGK